jgi:CubicO group peptidase (beta-lactamase class C family)
MSSVRRTRGPIALAITLVAVATTVCGSAVALAEPATSGSATGRFDRPRHGFAPEWTTLRDGTPEQVGLDRAPLDAVATAITEWTRPGASGHPLFSGAVSLLVHDGVVVSTGAAGYALRYADASGTELPEDQRVPMRPDTIFDMASISKLFTSIAVMQLVETEQVDLDAPVASYLPEFGVNGKESITVEQLLTHTSGLEPFLPLWRDWPDKPARIKAVMDVAPKNPPGSSYVYSDLNLIALGVLVERLSGSTLDAVVRDRITAPLGMTDTGYNPSESTLDRIAATEFSTNPPRGLVRGQVHDENTWSLGGVAGHAGVFSTARDMATLAQTILNGGSYRGARILRPDTVRAMLTNYNQEFPDNSHGLGFELNQRWYMGGLSAKETAGHTGFTGTSLVIDPASRSIAILLTNRVHPTRTWGSINIARESVSTALSKSLGVAPKRGHDAWYTEIGNASTATLTTDQIRPQGTVSVQFDTFVDSELTDTLVLEASSDGTTWQQVTMRAHGRGAPESEITALSGSGHRSWWTVTAELATTNAVALRWRFTTDSRYTGRGVYVDGIRVTEGNQVLLDGEKQPTRLDAKDWKVRNR